MEEIGGPYDGSDLTLLLPTQNLPPPPDSFWIPTSSPSFQGSSSMVNFENSPGKNTAVRPFFSPLDNEDNGNEEDNDRSFHQQEKKRRLNIDQVRFLERSFEVENKLSPERKVQLAKELGLQPRQIAIWFQNRRARYKTKQLEKDYDSLKAIYDKLKDDHDSLFKENENLKKEVHLLEEKLQGKEKSEPCDPIVSLDAQLDEKPIPGTISQSEANVPMVLCKQEDGNSAKSDVVDSESIESTHYTNGNRSSSLLEPANSSHVFELEQSDFSQDEEDNFSKSLMSLPCLPKLEDGCYNYPVEDQTFWFWPY